MVLSQLETGVIISSFKEIMLILQNEAEECFEENIRKDEKILLENFEDILKSLLNCKNAEENCFMLVTQFETKVLQRTYELKLPQRDYLKVLIPGYIALKLPLIEKLI